MNSDSATVDLQIASIDAEYSAPDLLSESFIKKPEFHWRFAKSLLVAGLALAIASSPTTVAPDFWFIEKRRRDTSTAVRILESSVGRAISRAEALRIARRIIERAERERMQFALWEATRGIQWEEG